MCACMYVCVYVLCMYVLWKPVYDWLLFLAFSIYWTACVAKLLHSVCCHNSHSFCALSVSLPTLFPVPCSLLYPRQLNTEVIVPLLPLHLTVSGVGLTLLLGAT